MLSKNLIFFDIKLIKIFKNSKKILKNSIVFCYKIFNENLNTHHIVLIYKTN